MQPWCFAALLLLLLAAPSALSNGISPHFLLGNLMQAVSWGKAPLADDGVSPLCLQQFKGLQNNAPYALEMIDASSKIPTGIFSGVDTDFGSFKECLAVSTEWSGSQVKGQYCLARTNFVKPPKGQNTSVPKSGITLEGFPQLLLAWCVPASCSAQEAQTLLNALLQTQKLGVETEFLEELCQTQDSISEPMTSGDWAVTAVLAVVLTIIGLSTLADIILQKLKRDAHPLVVSFSVYTNAISLFTTNTNPNQLPCLDGIRVLSMMWVILGHRYGFAMRLAPINKIYLLEFQKQFWNYGVIGATVSVDSFLVLSGTLLTYLFMKSREKGEPFNIGLFYLNRYLRITPLYLMLVLIHLTVLRHFGSGPLWKDTFTYMAVKPCEEYWWSGLLYVQNFVNPDEICIPQSWYLSLDMQLFILSPLILLPLAKWPKMTLCAIGCLICASVISPFMVGFINEFDPMMGIRTPAGWEGKYYQALHTRFGPYVIGIMLGYFIYKAKKSNFDFSKLKWIHLWNTLGWIISLLTMFAVVFGLYNIPRHDVIPVESGFYLGFHRNAWALALAFIIFSCANGYGGIANSFLSHPAFQVVGRLTFSMYLVSASVQLMVSKSSPIATYFSNVTNLFAFFGDAMFSLFFALCSYLAFEAPMLVVCKFLLRRSSRTTAKEA